jgi:hypothetical protein
LRTAAASPTSLAQPLHPPADERQPIARARHHPRRGRPEAAAGAGDEDVPGRHRDCSAAGDVVEAATAIGIGVRNRALHSDWVMIENGR